MKNYSSEDRRYSLVLSMHASRLLTTTIFLLAAANLSAAENYFDITIEDTTIKIPIASTFTKMDDNFLKYFRSIAPPDIKYLSVFAIEDNSLRSLWEPQYLYRYAAIATIQDIESAPMLSVTNFNEIVDTLTPTKDSSETQLDHTKITKKNLSDIFDISGEIVSLNAVHRRTLGTKHRSDTATVIAEHVLFLAKLENMDEFYFPATISISPVLAKNYVFFLYVLTPGQDEDNTNWAVETAINWGQSIADYNPSSATGIALDDQAVRYASRAQLLTLLLPVIAVVVLVILVLSTGNRNRPTAGNGSTSRKADKSNISTERTKKKGVDSFAGDVKYEIRMLEWCYQKLVSHQGSNMERNATLECFLLHTRNLTDFFRCPKGAQASDVTARDFFSNVEDWLEVEEGLLLHCREIKREINKYLSHITYDREDSVDWDIDRIYNEIMYSKTVFFDLLKLERA